MKKLVSILAIAIVSLVFTNAYAEDAPTVNGIHLTQGTTVEKWFALADEPVVTFNEDGQMVLSCKSASVLVLTLSEPVVVDFEAAPVPSVTLLTTADNEAGWINFGAKMAGETSYSDSREYILKATNAKNVSIAVSDADHFTVSGLNDGRFTISYEVPGSVASYKPSLEVKYYDYYGSEYNADFKISLDVNENGTATNLENNKQNATVRKIVKDGQVYIIYNGMMFNVLGAKIAE